VARFSESKIAREWLKRFADQERETAAMLLDEVLFVGADEFKRGMTALLTQVMSEREKGRPVAIYAEREVDWEADAIAPIFSDARTGKAMGDGPPPILFDPKEPEVGSEGLIATLITSFQRLHQDDVLNHPGPELMRDKRVGPIVILTDFIGSGQRVHEMLEAFRAVASLRSWKSYGYVRFYVVAYSGTEEGISLVSSNRLRPKVVTSAGCPILRSAIQRNARAAVYALCEKYPPGNYYPFGYRDSGALIAFEHGVPDNAPPILHEGWGSWGPLFPGRSSIGANVAFPQSNREELAERAETVLRMQDAARYISDARGRRWIKTMLVLTAIDQGARSVAEISAKTRLRLTRVSELVEFTQIAHWTTARNTLTQLGRAELQRLRKHRARTPVLPKQGKPFYYPGQLRAR
jgi:hypothetical protein